MTLKYENYFFYVKNTDSHFFKYNFYLIFKQQFINFNWIFYKFELLKYKEYS